MAKRGGHVSPSEKITEKTERGREHKEPFTGRLDAKRTLTPRAGLGRPWERGTTQRG